MQSPEAFRAAVRAKHSAAFSLHRDVAALLETAIEQPRHLLVDDVVSRAADMLMVQAYKAHGSVYFLAVRAHVEDAATITRRLLEIAVQLTYIAGHGDPEVHRQRAGQFLAYFWESIPDGWRRKFPMSERTAWETLHQTHRHLLRKKRWGPTFIEMFQDIGRSDTYDEDYSLLSNIAHGTPSSLVLDYAEPVVKLHSDVHVPLVLVFASRYSLALARHWNDVFHIIPDGELSGLAGTATRFFDAGA